MGACQSAPPPVTPSFNEVKGTTLVDMQKNNNEALALKTSMNAAERQYKEAKANGADDAELDMLGAKYTNAKEAREFLFKAMQKEQEALQKMDDAQKINGFAETQARTTAILNEMKADLSDEKILNINTGAKIAQASVDVRKTMLMGDGNVGDDDKVKAGRRALDAKMAKESA